MPERPEGVGDDWLLVDCTNPACNLTVWVPPNALEQAREAGIPIVKAVCSAACAKALMLSLT
jgi:hypothetical protein